MSAPEQQIIALHLRDDNGTPMVFELHPNGQVSFGVSTSNIFEQCPDDAILCSVVADDDLTPEDGRTYLSFASMSKVTMTTLPGLTLAQSMKAALSQPIGAKMLYNGLMTKYKAAKDKLH